MKIGILELGEYQFIQDVAKRLGDIGTEFITTAEQRFPPENKYRVIIDRLSFTDPYLRQVMMLASLNGAYVINNPFASFVNNKMLNHLITESLHIKQPQTMVLPRVNEEWELGGSVREPAWEDIRRQMTFPCILKPFDGFAWTDVYTVASFRELENLYSALKNKQIMLLQEKIEYKDFFRVFCINKRDVLIVRYIPKPAGLGQYMHPEKKSIDDFGERITEATIRLNKKMDFDFNAIEWCVDDDGELYIIDAMNEVPDIDRKFIPDEYYHWILDKFCALVREKFNSSENNKTFFDGAQN